MKLHVLGTGTPVLDALRPATTAILVELTSQKLLFDAGRGVTMQLLKQGFSPVDVDAIFITHHHYDHICDLGEVLLSAWHNGRSQPVTVYGPPGTAAIITALFEQVFHRDILFSQALEPADIALYDLVQVTDIRPGWQLETADWRISAEQMSHGDNLQLPAEEWLCLGYRLEAAGKVVAIGGDTVPCPGLNKLAQTADALVLSCYWAQAELTDSPLAEMAQHIIASSAQVGKMAAQAHAKSLILTHFRPKSADMMAALEADVRADFVGTVYIADDLTIVEL